MRFRNARFERNNKGNPLGWIFPYIKPGSKRLWAGTSVEDNTFSSCDFLFGFAKVCFKSRYCLP